MERQMSSSPAEETDAVAETLERLEVADTLEQLRHHIDDLIARLSEHERGDSEPTVAVAPELETQIAQLGMKVESASDLLTELTDLLEAQTERIETIEQQLGDPDPARYPMSGQPAVARDPGIPTFSMRPPPPATAAAAAPTDATDALREYVDARLERLEDCLSAVETRVAELCAAAGERDRHVRELEERLLILVDAGVERDIVPQASARLQPSGAPNAYVPRPFAPAASRPPAMPLFAHHSASLERRLVRPQTPSPRASARDPRDTAPERGARSADEEDAGGGGDDTVTLSIRPADAADPAAAVQAEATLADERGDFPSRNGAAAAAACAQRVSELALERDEEEHGPLTGVAARLLGRESPGVRMLPAADLATARTAGGVHEASPVGASRSDAHAGPSEDDATESQGPGLPLDVERLVERDARSCRDFVATRGEWADRHGARPGRTRPIVLVVDDAPDALSVLSIFLSKTGYQVVTASSAEDCLAKLRHHQIDAVVLDAKMPGADGGHVCRVLREDPAYASRRDVPVIVYTGYPDDFPSGVREAWRADDYVVKGGDMLPLITALVRHTTAGDA